MKLRFKKLDPNAVLPAYAKPGDAGLDLTVISFETDGHVYKYGTGLAVEIPPGHVGLVFPRSSVHKMDLSLTNCVGVIDSGYRGEIKAVFKSILSTADMVRRSDGFQMYKPGDRALQMIVMPYPACEVEEVQELSQTVRGEGGFGSSGK